MAQELSMGIGSLLWFVAIVAAIPLVLWLVKRTPVGGGASSRGGLRTVDSLALAPQQRVLTVEVGQGEERRWLVLGVTAQQINLLYTLSPAEAPQPTDVAAPFAQLMTRLAGRERGGWKDESKDGR